MIGKGSVALVLLLIVADGAKAEAAKPEDASKELKEFLSPTLRTGRITESSERDTIILNNDGASMLLPMTLDEDQTAIFQTSYDGRGSLENVRNYLDDNAREAMQQGWKRLQIHEYITLREHGIPDSVCTSVGEMLYYFSTNTQCLVCVCLYQEEQMALRPVCVSCRGCMQTNAIIPDQVPKIPEVVIDVTEIITPVPEPIDILPLVRPDAEPSCYPLPENQQFQHPLNPCQICSCSRVLAPSGVDVRISCQANHQCVIPVKELNIPNNHFVPMPQCRGMPPRVMMPHPTDRCKQCMCSEDLVHYICEESPGCEQIPEIGPYPVEPYYPPGPYITDDPEPPIPEVIQYIHEEEIIPANNRPLIEEDITVIEVVEEPPPFQPAVPGKAPMKSPLPGPRPHTSCRPFRSNVPFQHPWDPCKVCLCTEALMNSVIDIEVNCFTKTSCCVIEPEFITNEGEESRIITGQQSSAVEVFSDLIFLDLECKQHLPLQMFERGCSKCYCDVLYNLVKLNCSPIPGCYSTFEVDVPQTPSSYIYDKYSQPPYPFNGGYKPGMLPGQYNIYNGQPQVQVVENIEVIADEKVLPYPSLGGKYKPYNPSEGQLSEYEKFIKYLPKQMIGNFEAITGQDKGRNVHITEDVTVSNVNPSYERPLYGEASGYNTVYGKNTGFNQGQYPMFPQQGNSLSNTNWGPSPSNPAAWPGNRPAGGYGKSKPTWKDASLPIGYQPNPYSSNSIYSGMPREYNAPSLGAAVNADSSVGMNRWNGQFPPGYNKEQWRDNRPYGPDNVLYATTQNRPFSVIQGEIQETAVKRPTYFMKSGKPQDLEETNERRKR